MIRHYSDMCSYNKQLESHVSAPPIFAFCTRGATVACNTRSFMSPIRACTRRPVFALQKTLDYLTEAYKKNDPMYMTGEQMAARPFVAAQAKANGMADGDEYLKVLLEWICAWSRQSATTATTEPTNLLN